MLSLVLLTCAALPTSYSLSSSTDQQYESDLLRQGLALSSRHSKAFPQLFRGQFFKAGNKKKGKERNRIRRAFWGLDKFFTDAQKTRNHFGGLSDRIGNVFEDEDEQVKLKK